MSAPAISLEQVSKFFGDFPAVRGVTLQVEAGGLLALLGRNGAGKSTLLHLIAGLSRPTEGRIRFSPENGPAPRDSRARIGMVGHGQWLYDDLTAEENLRFFARVYGVADREAKISQWLETTGLSRFRASRVNEFSRGMRQRLAIARAFLHEPDVLLLDEPWTALDDRAVHFLTELLDQAHARGATIVVCSHQLAEALRVATSVAVLDRGRLVYQGAVTDGLRAAPETLYDQIT